MPFFDIIATFKCTAVRFHYFGTIRSQICICSIFLNQSYRNGECNRNYFPVNGIYKSIKKRVESVEDYIQICLIGGEYLMPYSTYGTNITLPCNSYSFGSGFVGNPPILSFYAHLFINIIGLSIGGIIRSVGGAGVWCQISLSWENINYLCWPKVLLYQPQTPLYSPFGC